MSRGQLPRVYLRLDPDIDQTHPDHLDGFIRLLCAANRQRPRGRFRSRNVLDNLFGKRATDRLYARGDVVTQDDGSVLMPGWDIWQEGDMTVNERVARLREKRRMTDA